MFTSRMPLALDQARAAAGRGESPIGAVLTAPDGTVIAADGNRVRELADPTAHAEMLVIRAAARALASERLTGCGLTVTLEPCPMCAGAISLARIARRRRPRRPRLLAPDLPPCARGLRRPAGGRVRRPAAPLLPRSPRLRPRWPAAGSRVRRTAHRAACP